MNQHHSALISEILETCGIFQQYLDDDYVVNIYNNTLQHKIVVINRWFHAFLTYLAKFNPNKIFSRAKWLFYPVKLFSGLLLVQSPKNCDFGHFSARLAKIGQNENFYKKSGRAIFYPYCPPNFMPSFRKIVGAVSEINSLRTSGHMDKGDITEPVAFTGSILNQYYSSFLEQNDCTILKTILGLFSVKF